MLSLFINLCWKARSFSLICDCWSCQALSSEKTVLAFIKTVRILKWQLELDGIWCMKSSLRSPGWLRSLGRCKGGNPHIQKTECFIREFLLDEETVHVTGEGYRRGEGLGLLMPLTKELIVGPGQWLWTWIPDTSSLSQPCPRLMTSWELFIHFDTALPTSSSFEREQGWVSPQLQGPQWVAVQLRESIETIQPSDVSMDFRCPLHWNPFGKRSQSGVLKL